MPEPAGGEKGRYETLFLLASGGMASVHVGTVRGAFGFRQLVAIKKPHAHLLDDPDFRQMLLREARLASLIHHANVVDVRDVEATEKEVSLIMDYVEGASLGELLQVQAGGGTAVPPGVAVRIVLDACAGLHAAHEQTDERGRPLRLVHRDISPQNLLVGVDGLTRVADFGVAKFKRSSATSTIAGVLKGKLAYMAPEYVRGEGIDRRMDVFAMGVVLWEALTGKRLFRGEHGAATLERVLSHEVRSVATVVPELGTAFDAIVETALAKDPNQRFDNASAMAAALESSARVAGVLVGHREVAELVKKAVGPKLEERKALIRARLASEPSVASLEFEPGVVQAILDANPPGSATIPEATLAAIRARADAAGSAPKPLGATVVPSTLRSEEKLEPDGNFPAADAASEIVVAPTTGSRREEAIHVPMEGGGAGRYGLAFVVIAVAVAAAVVGIAQLRARSASAVSSASVSSAAPSASTPAPPPPRPSAVPGAGSAPPRAAPAGSASTPPPVSAAKKPAPSPSPAKSSSAPSPTPNDGTNQMGY
jgi:serine/threonine-protein kinase